MPSTMANTPKNPDDQLTDQRRAILYGDKPEGLSAREHSHLRWLLTHFVSGAPDEKGNRTFTFRGELLGRTLEEAIDARILAEVKRQGQDAVNAVREEMVRAAHQGPVHLDEIEQRVMHYMSKGHDAVQDAMRNVMVNGRKVCERATMLALQQKGFVRATRTSSGAAVAWTATELGQAWKPG